MIYRFCWYIAGGEVGVVVVMKARTNRPNTREGARRLITTTKLEERDQNNAELIGHWVQGLRSQTIALASSQ